MGKIQRTAEGHGYKFGTRSDTYTTWPKGDHSWGMFAGLAVELGGYGDVELTDPNTGRTFWFQPSPEARELQCSVPDAWPFVHVLKQALDAAEAVGWFDDVNVGADEE